MKTFNYYDNDDIDRADDWLESISRHVDSVHIKFVPDMEPEHTDNDLRARFWCGVAVGIAIGSGVAVSIGALL